MDQNPLGPSPHFTWAELTFSDAALRSGIDNTPNAAQRANLARLATTLLEPARELIGIIHVNSGFRSQTVNDLVGSTAIHSAHLDGRAADCRPMAMSIQDAFALLRARLKGWDQLIIECNAWIHIAVPVFGVQPRLEALVASGSPGNWTYTRAA